MARRGQPCKLTPELQAEICKLLRWGNDKKTTAETCGITRETLWNWLKKGEKAKSGQFFDFFHAVKKAIAESDVMHLRNIVNAGNGMQKHVESFREVDENGKVTKERYMEKTILPQWQASAWYLERTKPEIYGRKVQVDVTWRDKLKEQGIDPEATLKALVESSTPPNLENPDELEDV